MREVYTKEDMFAALESALSDGMVTNIILGCLVDEKLHRLQRERRELFTYYEEYYLPHVDKHKANEKYSISQPMIKKINKTIDKINKLDKQIAGYIKLKEDPYSRLDKRKESILKMLKKSLGA